MAKDKLKKLKDFYELQKPKIQYLIQFFFVVLVYGIMICFVLSQLTSFLFSIKNIFALGIISYIVKMELPRIISQCFPKSPPPIIMQ